MANLGQVFPIAEDRSVDVPCIEAELRRIWLGTPDARDDDDAPVTRVCTLNLVAIAPDSRSASRASEAGAAITARYPCRVIIATADAHGPDALEASVSAYCHPSGASSKPICCERISLYASGNTVDQLSWAITPLLAPDVPVFVWLQGNVDLASPLYERIVAMADRLIVDAQSAVHPESWLPKMVEYVGLERPAVTGMAWRRTAHWRELVASLFDPPAFRMHIGTLRELEIGYSPGVAGTTGWLQAQAALVGTWICDRFDWKSQGKFERDSGVWTLNVSTPAGPGKVTLKPDALARVAPGDLTSVVFPICDGCGVSFSAQRVRDRDMIELQVQRPDVAPINWRQASATSDTASLLGQELERPHGSPAFEDVIRILTTSI